MRASCAGWCPCCACLICRCRFIFCWTGSFGTCCCCCCHETLLKARLKSSLGAEMFLAPGTRHTETCAHFFSVWKLKCFSAVTEIILRRRKCRIPQHITSTLHILWFLNYGGCPFISSSSVRAAPRQPGFYSCILFSGWSIKKSESLSPSFSSPLDGFNYRDRVWWGKKEKSYRSQRKSRNFNSLNAEITTTVQLFILHSWDWEEIRVIWPQYFAMFNSMTCHSIGKNHHSFPHWHEPRLRLNVQVVWFCVIWGGLIQWIGIWSVKLRKMTPCSR